MISSRKAQFMVLTAFTMISIFFLISQWTRPYRLLDTAEIVLLQDPFIFNNIKEKALVVVNTSESCEDLVDNLEEYENYVEDYTFKKLTVYFDYTIETPCYEYKPGFPILVIFDIEIQSDKMSARDTFYGFWPPESAPY